jgi:hypothetical protein
MKEQIKLLIEQHKLHKNECEEELNSLKNYIGGEFTFFAIQKEVEMRTLFISELEQLLEQC